MNNSFLTGETIYLRPITETDLTPTYREWFNDEEVCKFNTHHRFPNYDQNMKDYYNEVIKPHHDLVLAICDSLTNQHIGNVSLQSINHLDQSAEFAIVIGEKSFWGKGVGNEALTLIVRHGFEALNLHRIYCDTTDDNVGMQKLAIALGFTEEGRARDAHFQSGKFKDLIHYGLLRNEFTKK